MTTQDLIARLEAATGPDEQIDADICATVLGHALAKAPNASHFVYRRHDDAGYNWQRIPAFTASLDAALTLVPEGWGVQRVMLHTADTMDVRAKSRGSSGATPAIALCIAALKAKSHHHKAGEEK